MSLTDSCLQLAIGVCQHYINGMISSFKFLNNNFLLSRGIAPIRGHALGFYLGKILFVVPFLNSTVSCSCYPDDVERVRSYMYDII